MGTLEGRIRKGASWMVLFKFGERSLGLISTVVLARLLIPEDFGLVAMASVVVAFLELLSAFGFDMAVIQNRSADRHYYDTAWTFNVLFGAISSAVLVLLAIPASHFFQEPRLASVLAVLALSPLVGGLENIGVVAFRKELAFDREFRFLLGKKLASFVVTISLAVVVRSYWAMVTGIVAGRLFGVALSYYLHPYRPKLCLIAWNKLINFSKWLLLNNFISYFYLRSADFVVGKLDGASSLGVYSIASEIANLPTTELIAPINRAIFPGYAKMSEDIPSLREGFLKVIAAVAALALPAAAGVAATAELLVNTIFGEKWAGAVPIIQVLAFYGAITALETNTYYVHLALGNVRKFTALIGASVVVLVPLLIVFTSHFGAIGAAISRLVVAVFFFPLFYRAVMKRLALDLRQVITRLWKPILATAIMYLLVSKTSQYLQFDTILGDLAELFGIVLLGIVSYACALLGLWRLAGKPEGVEQFLIDNVVRFVRRRIHTL